jgi:hypothetical protein
VEPPNLTRVRATTNFSTTSGIVRHGEHVLVDLEDPGIKPLVEKGIIVPVAPVEEAAAVEEVAEVEPVLTDETALAEDQPVLDLDQ